MGEWVEAGMSSNESWKPENEGDKIIGVYVRTKGNVGMNNSTIYTLKTENGLIDVWGSAVLDNKFSEIPLNSQVKVEFLGRKKGKGPVQYKDFKVLYIVPTKSTNNELADKATELFG